MKDYRKEQICIPSVHLSIDTQLRVIEYLERNNWNYEEFMQYVCNVLDAIDDKKDYEYRNCDI